MPRQLDTDTNNTLIDLNFILKAAANLFYIWYQPLARSGSLQRFIYPSRSLAFLILPNPILILADVFEADPILILADILINPSLAEKGARLGWNR